LNDGNPSATIGWRSTKRAFLPAADSIALFCPGAVPAESRLRAVTRLYRQALHTVMSIGTLRRLPSLFASDWIQAQSGAVGSNMADIASSGKPPRPHGLDWRPVLDSYRTQTEGLREHEEIDRAAAESVRTATEPDYAPTEGRNEMAAPVNLRKLQEQLDRNRLDEIATLVLALTYGEMIDLANAIWKAQPDALPLTQETLPALLYRWSKAQSALPPRGHEESSTT
jgi:hypothetical protein